MRIILAEPRGFCAGVNMAIEALATALAAHGAPLYVYHEIVHNKWVVDSFRQKGVVFVDDLSKCPRGHICSTRPTACRRAFGKRPDGGG